ncbi:Ras-GAP domain-containing protein [Plasmodiophora brassicae]
MLVQSQWISWLCPSFEPTMALRWLNRVKGPSSLLRSKQRTSLVVRSQHDLFSEIVSACDKEFCHANVDNDALEAAIATAFSDPVLQTRAKQAYQAMVNDFEQRPGVSVELPASPTLVLMVSVLREAVFGLEDTVLSAKQLTSLSTSVTDPGLNETSRIHSVRVVFDQLNDYARKSVRQWVDLFATTGKRSRVDISPGAHQFVLQFCAFIVLSQTYHRNRFISLSDLTNPNAAGSFPINLGRIMLQHAEFLFLDVEEASSVRQARSASLADTRTEETVDVDASPRSGDAQRAKEHVAQDQHECHALADENRRLRDILRKSSTTQPSNPVDDLFGSALNSSPSVFVWQQLHSGGDQPTPRHQHSSAFDGDRSRLIVYGGISNDRQLDDVWLLDVACGRWERAPVLRGRTPRGRHGHAAIVIQSKMFVFGGVTGHACTNDLLVLDTAIWKWRQWTGGVVGLRPEPRQGHRLARLSDTDFLLFGGRNAMRAYNDVWRYSSTSDTWTPIGTVGESPSPRHLHSFVRVGQAFAVAGGVGDRGSLLDANVSVLGVDFRWGATTPLVDAGPQASGGMLMELVGRDLLLISDAPPPAGEPMGASVSRFRPTLFRWSAASWSPIRVDVGPSARAGACLCAAGPDRAVLFGGFADGHPANDVWILERQ